MICVYPSNCTNFSSNGLGAVLPMTCTVTETLNGEWELALTHPIDDADKWTRLAEGNILRAPVPAAMTPRVDLVIQQYQTTTYDVQIYKITTKSGPLRLRSGTCTKYKILGKYKKGKEVIVLDKTTFSWYEVTAPDGKHGYMSSQYLTFQRTETQFVQTDVGFHKGSDGCFYALSIAEDGTVTTTKKIIGNSDVADNSLSGGKLLESTITARELNVVLSSRMRRSSARLLPPTSMFPVCSPPKRSLHS